jgi:hypothetical protein
MVVLTEITGMAVLVGTVILALVGKGIIADFTNREVMG